MRKNYKKIAVAVTSAILVLAIASAILLVIGRTPDAEKIFNRTYEEYADATQVVSYVGENLDGTDGMIVYAQGVAEIRTDGSTNAVVSADAQSRQYTFQNPSVELTSLQNGDVFFVTPGENCPDGIAAKVDWIERKGDLLTVYGGELALDELFEYVSIHMEIDLPCFAYDSADLNEGMEIESTTSVEPTAARMTVRPQADALALSGGATEWGGTVNTSLALKHDVNVSLGSSSGNQQKACHFIGQYALEIRTVRVLFRYDSTEGFLGAGVWVDYRTSWESSIEFEGNYKTGKNGKGTSWPVLKAYIPNTIIMVKVDCYVLSELSGKFSGSISQSESRTAGFTVEITEAGSAPLQYDQLNGKSSEINANIEGTAETTFGIRGTIGVVFLAEAYLEIGAGAQAEGQLHVFSAGSEEHADEIHDCRKCVDGDAYLLLRLRAGIDFTLLQKEVGKDLSVSWDLAEIKQKIGDFYASYRSGEEILPECGAGECPHRSYRVDVTVVKPSGVKADFAQVTVKYPDLRTYTITTDAGGKVELYLPVGDNWLTAEYSGLRGTMQVLITNRPAQAAIKLNESEPNVIICYTVYCESEKNSLLDSFDYPELKTALDSIFPDAEWINRYNPDRADISRWTYEELAKNYQWMPGDIIIEIEVDKTRQVRVGESYEWRHGTKWSNGLVFEPCEYVYDISVTLSQLLLVPSDYAQIGGLISEDDKIRCQLYHMEYSHRYEWDSSVKPGPDELVCYYPMTSSTFQSSGFAVTNGGLQFDDTFTVTGQDPAILNEWDFEEIAPQFDTVREMAQSGVISAALAQRVSQIAPYVELLQGGRWFEEIDDLLQGEASAF